MLHRLADQAGGDREPLKVDKLLILGNLCPSPFRALCWTSPARWHSDWRAACERPAAVFGPRASIISSNSARVITVLQSEVVVAELPHSPAIVITAASGGRLEASVAFGVQLRRPVSAAAPRARDLLPVPRPSYQEAYLGTHVETYLMIPPDKVKVTGKILDTQSGCRPGQMRF